jgi:hypothetical protein
MRTGFAHFAAFSKDTADNKVFEQVKLTLAVLAMGGEKSFGPLQAVLMRHGGSQGTGSWKRVPCTRSV